MPVRYPGASRTKRKHGSDLLRSAEALQGGDLEQIGCPWSASRRPMAVSKLPGETDKTRAPPFAEPRSQPFAVPDHEGLAEGVGESSVLLAPDDAGPAHQGTHELRGVALRQRKGALRDEDARQGVTGVGGDVDERVALLRRRQERLRDVDRAKGVDPHDQIWLAHLRAHPCRVDDGAHAVSVRRGGDHQIAHRLLIGDVADESGRRDAEACQLLDRLVDAILAEVGDHDAVVAAEQLRRREAHPAGTAGDDCCVHDYSLIR